MTNKLLTGIIIGGTVLSTSAAAYAMGPQDGQGLRTGGGFGGDNPNREAIEEAFENNDYQAWYDITVDSPKGEELLSIINEDNFDLLIEAHNLKHDGDIEGAKAIMEQLGMPDFGQHKGFEGGEKMLVVKDALENNDYEAWLAAIADAPNYDEIVVAINESNFDQLVEAHQLMQDGDFEGAKAIADELGITDLLPNRNGGKNNGRMEGMKEIMEVVATGDYDQFVELIQDKPMADMILEKINESNFDQVVAMHELVKSGDFEGAKAIGEELGFDGPMFGGKNHKSGKKGQGNTDRANQRLEDGINAPTVG